jgi:hypothetical protein
MILKIDIEKSIEKKRLYQESKFAYYSDFMIYGFPALLFFILIVSKILQGTKDGNGGDLLLGIVFWITIFPLTFYNLFNMNKMRELTIKDKKKTIKYIHTLITKNKWEIKKESDEILIIETALTYPRERQVTFIFRNNQLFINSMTVRDSMKYTLLYNSDRRFTDSIIDNLTANEMIQNDFS